MNHERPELLISGSVTRVRVILFPRHFPFEGRGWEVPDDKLTTGALSHATVPCFQSTHLDSVLGFSWCGFPRSGLEAGGLGVGTQGTLGASLWGSGLHLPQCSWASSPLWGLLGNKCHGPHTLISLLSQISWLCCAPKGR